MTGNLPEDDVDGYYVVQMENYPTSVNQNLLLNRLLASFHEDAMGM